MSNILRKLPNYLTFLRLGLIPVFVLLMADTSRWSGYLAAFVFAVAAFTDLLDGFLARRYGAVSELGKLLDPLADKILVMAALVMLVAQRGDLDGAPWVPGWMVVLVLARELWITGLRAVIAQRGTVLAASASGKVKSWFQMIAVIFLLLHYPVLEVAGLVVSFQAIGVNLLIISIAFSLWSAAEYTYQWLGYAQPSASSTVPPPAGVR